jgi:hypothetical protein
LRENDEHGLRNLLGRSGITRAAERHRIHEVQIPGSEACKRILVTGLGVLQQAILIVKRSHLQVSCMLPAKKCQKSFVP